jgi:Zn-finger nucleic acid-binding protein
MKKDVIFNVIIDRCHKCGGVWLDGGELEILKKTIESGAESDFVMGVVVGMAAS